MKWLVLIVHGVRVDLMPGGIRIRAKCQAEADWVMDWLIQEGYTHSQKELD